MTLLFLQNSLESIIIGVISNIVFTLLLIYGVQQFRYWYRLRRHFHNATFDTYRKRFPNEIVQTVTCKVTGNRIKFSGNRINHTDTFEGEIIVNPFNLRTGEGFHAHTESEGYAFLKVIIKDDNTFLVDAPYTKVVENEKKAKISSIVYQAFIWRKRNDKTQ
jgi:hypothetical protein